VTDAPGAVADPLPDSVHAILKIPRGQRSEAQEQAVFRYWRTTVAEWSSENDAIAQLWRDHPEGSRQLVLAERTEDPRVTHILKRGDFLQPERAVTPGVPSFLNPLPADAPPNRLTFARWLVDRQSPTTARSIVNRVWQSYFGTGIVATVENLGTQAETPSNQQRDSRVADQRSRQPADRARSALSRGCRSGARHRFGRQRITDRQDRWTQRLCARAGASVPTAGELLAQDVGC
jgi:hypothetical protein